jgi:hypothetical protein
VKTFLSALFGAKRAEALRRAEPVVNVGLDVGTASTKIVVQDVVDRKAKPIALRLGEGVAGYCPVATPSTVAVVDGKLTFGALAERAGPSAVILRSLKVCTACQYSALTCRGCPYRAADCLTGRGGIFSIPTPTGPVRATAQDMLTLYVAWTRREALRVLEELFPGLKPSRTLWNVAVPLGQVDTFAINDAYNVLLGTAVELDGLIEQEVDLETALSCLRDLKREVTRAPSEAERTFFLVPETLAAIQGYIHLPATKLGLYGIVDVGAGTTDVSFFDLYDKADRKLAFYAADAKAVGGDDFDLAAASALLDGHLTQPLDRARLGSLASLVRSARASSRGRVSVDGRSFDLYAREVIRAEEVIAGRVWHAAHDVFEAAYVQKLRSTGYWHHLPVLLVGGGSLNQRVDLAFARLLCPYTTSQPISHLQASKVIAPGPGLSSRDVQGSLQFLLVAYGLSHPRVEFPDFERPSEVPNFQRPPEAERFDANDLYAK